MPARLVPLPLTAERFAPFGDVIEDVRAGTVPMNDARFERFGALCNLDTDGETDIGIVRCRTATSLPFHVDMVERHPLGSQAFVPLDGQRFLVAVAEPGAPPERLHAFVSNGRQGVNYRRGTWHMPLIGLETGQRFLVIDRQTLATNCDTHKLAEPVLLELAK